MHLSLSTGMFNECNMEEKTGSTVCPKAVFRVYLVYTLVHGRDKTVAGNTVIRADDGT